MDFISAAKERALVVLQESEVEITRHPPLNNEAYAMVEVVFTNSEGAVFGTVINAAGDSQIPDLEMRQHAVRGMIHQLDEALRFYDIEKGAWDHAKD